MSSRSKFASLVLAIAFMFVINVAASRLAVAAADHEAGRLRNAGQCEEDADCDGISDAIEAAVGGAGIDPAPPTTVTSATQDPAGIHITLASPLLQGEATVDLPPGTAAGATPIMLELDFEPLSSGHAIVVHHAQVPAGVTKTVTLAISSSSLHYVVLNDTPGATRASLASAPRSSRFTIPECPCPASNSTNLNGDATAYTITNLNGGTVAISGLLHSAAGVTSASDPVCDEDADCDGISDAIEAAVGGGGIDPAPGTSVTSATQDPGGGIDITLASALLADQAAIQLPQETTAGTNPIVLEFDVTGSSSEPFVAVHDAQVPPGSIKSITVPVSSSSQLYVALNDTPGATGASLAAAPRSARFAIPVCPCPASTSTNLNGDATAYTITNVNGSRVQIRGLSHSAVGVTNASEPVAVGGTDPLVFRLHPNHPNPFNRSTTIRFDLPRRAAVSVRIYDVRGRLVRTLRTAMAFEPGGHEVTWDGKAHDERRVGPGVYFCELSGTGFRSVRRMVKLR